jgi:CRISPR-associated protein Csb1
MTNSPAVALSLTQLLAANGPTCLIIKAKFEPLADQDRFQPAGFPEMGHVIYDAPRVDEDGNAISYEKVCIVDSAASMANHLETLCFSNPTASILHDDLSGLPYVRCVTDPNSRLVVTTLSEGHRLASDYFLDGKLNGQNFREALRAAFGIVEIKKDKAYFVTPDDWWTIYKTIFRYDPNSLVHGILFAKEQIKISRLLAAHLEAFGAARVGSAGVKFDRLGKTNSGQPIFSKDEETAKLIQATFLIDLGLLRSYGHEERGLGDTEKRLLLELALWKVQRMLTAPFRFRSGCHLRCVSSTYSIENPGTKLDATTLALDMAAAIQACNFGATPVTDVIYPSNKLFSVESSGDATEDDEAVAIDGAEEETGA